MITPLQGISLLPLVSYIDIKNSLSLLVLINFELDYLDYLVLRRFSINLNALDHWIALLII